MNHYIPLNRLQLEMRKRWRIHATVMGTCIFMLTLAIFFGSPRIASAEEVETAPIFTNCNTEWDAVDGVTALMPTSEGYCDVDAITLPAHITASDLVSVKYHVVWSGTRKAFFGVSDNTHSVDHWTGSISCQPTPDHPSNLIEDVCTFDENSPDLTWNWLPSLSNLDILSIKRGMIGAGDGSQNTIDALYVTIVYDDPLLDPFLNLYNLSGDVVPEENVTFRMYWQEMFYGFDDTSIKYAYFFPYNQVEGCYTELGTLCEEAVYSSIGNIGSASATGSGSFTFNYAYHRNGSFTGAVLLSDTTACDIETIYTDSFCDDHIQIARVGVQVGSFVSLPITSPTIATTIFTNGGGSSGAYLITNKQTYFTGEPIYMKWRFDLGGLDPSEIRVYSGSGNEIITTLTGTGDLLENVYHAGQIHYQHKGEYQPFIRACVGDCSSTWQDIYIGGGTVPDFSKSITVIDREVVNGVEQGGSASVIGGIGGGEGFLCTDRGIFGLGSEFFYVSFDETANIFYQGIELLINKGVDGIMWISSNIMCALENAPLIANVGELIAPAEGEYDLPTQLFGATIDPVEMFGQDSYTVEYNDDSITGDIGDIVASGVFAYFSIFFIMKGIFGHRKSPRRA